MDRAHPAHTMDADAREQIALGHAGGKSYFSGNWWEDVQGNAHTNGGYDMMWETTQATPCRICVCRSWMPTGVILTSFDYSALSSPLPPIRPHVLFLPLPYHLSHPRGQQTADTLSWRTPNTPSRLARRRYHETRSPAPVPPYPAIDVNTQTRWRTTGALPAAEKGTPKTTVTRKTNAPKTRCQWWGYRTMDSGVSKKNDDIPLL